MGSNNTLSEMNWIKLTSNAQSELKCVQGRRQMSIQYKPFVRIKKSDKKSD